MIDYNKIACVYDGKYHSDMSMRENASVKELLRKYILQGDRVLDVGCGTAFTLDCIDIHETDYLGIDCSKKMLKVAAQKYPNHDFIRSDIKDVSLHKRFDAAVCLFCIPYIKPSGAEKIMESLKVGGKCVCVYYEKPFYNTDSVYHDRVDEFYSEIKPAVKEVIEVFAACGTMLENRLLTPDETYRVSVFRRDS